MEQKLLNLYHDTGIYQLELGQAIMMVVGLLLIYLAIKKGFEPLLLLPIGKFRKVIYNTTSIIEIHTRST